MNQTTATAVPLPAVHFLTHNAALSASLGPILFERGVSLESFATRDRLLRRLAVAPGGLLLVDTEALADPDTLGALAEEIQMQLGQSMPLACLVAGQDIRPRLAAMRAGAKAYLQTPMEIEELAERLLDLVEAHSPFQSATHGEVQNRVLVVDDQPVAALFAARVLEAAGMLTERVGDPLAVLDALESFVPDLVLMDLHMPGATGIELTRIIRAQDRFADLPIVFLSAELDTQQQMAALRVGGDDFLAKPVAPDQLVAAVAQRLRRVRERARREGARDAIDPMTGLASLGRLLGRLGQLIGRGGADMDRRALVSLELAGDEETLTRLAVMLAEQAGASDLAARVGERALAMLMRRDDPAALERACTSLTEHLNSSCPEQGLGVGWCTLASSGGDAVTLVSRAGKAARSALEAGDRCPLVYRRERVAEDRGIPEPLLAALLAERLQLLFEPMVTISQSSVARYEVSPRLSCADGELLPPSEFMALAQRAGLAERIDRWLLSAGLNALMTRHAHGQPVQLFIHQSLESVGREDWVDQMRDEINRRELFRLRPVLQFQVEEVAAEADLMTDRVGRLRRLGIRVCLNGLDPSARSQQALEKVPATFVRLARGVAESLDQASLSAFVQGAKAGGAIVIAAGVEAPESIARLCRAGADLLQGPFVRPPSAAMDYDFGGNEVG